MKKIEMNFVSVIVLFASVFLALVHGLPAIDTPVENPEETAPLRFVRSLDGLNPAELGTMFLRVRCDLFGADSPMDLLSHAACNGHCLLTGKGFGGARCIDGVCHCQK